MLSNNPLDFVLGIIRQYSPSLRRIIVKYCRKTHVPFAIGSQVNGSTRRTSPSRRISTQLYTFPASSPFRTHVVDISLILGEVSL